MSGKLAVVACIAGALALSVTACTGDDDPRGPSCAAVDSDAGASVAGTYRYTGPLRGSITLEQSGNAVHLVNTTYDTGDDRPLVGDGTIAGNVVEMRMVPENGDTDYIANVRFVFEASGDRFCVEFSDTNGDRGGLGSYVGRRQ